MASLSKKRLDNVGRALSGACVTLIVLLVATLVFMVAQHGLATFFVDGISPAAFFTGTTWNPHQADASGDRRIVFSHAALHAARLAIRYWVGHFRG